MVGESEVVRRDLGAGLVGAELALLRRQGPLEQPDRLGKAARIPIGSGQVPQRTYGAGVVRAELALPLRRSTEAIPLFERTLADRPASR